ncbi:MAG: rRNA maturation RNase YbeY [Parafilimonas sp.]
MKKILFYSSDATVNLKNRSAVKLLIIFLFTEEMITLNGITYFFCSDEYLFEINRRYLNHNTYTDVITFPLSNPHEPIVGEIYISSERIKENAKNYKVSYQSELVRVLIHGALHLCGYNDDTALKKEQMRSKENFYLKKFKVSREAFD